MDDNRRDTGEMPDEISVLFIEGYGICGPWFANKFWTCGHIMGQQPFGSTKNYRVWCTDPSDLNVDNGDILPDDFGVEACITEIESGKYHAIVVVDYSDATEDFDNSLGSHLQKFVQAGGVVAFPSSESLLLPSLKMFGVEWVRSAYYRTNWSPCEENMDKIHHSLGNGSLSRRVLQPYSAKGNTFRSVPVHERCFGVGSDSRTQSLVPMMNGRDVSRGSDGNQNDYDIIVAMHDYGKGAIAYFGDVNAEEATIWLVASFVESRSPKHPIDVFSGLSASQFASVKQLKEQGNQEFGDANMVLAKGRYRAALDLLGSRLGLNGAERDMYVTLCSNLALVHLKTKDYHDAERIAGRGLDAEWGHGKCSYRRAMARLHISLDTQGGDLSRLKGASKDILNSDPGDATWKLLLRIKKEIKRLEEKELREFSSEFASAMSGAFG
eukprot:CAMPEP_0172405678 /NCGR_PEP_ID=MMETSP1061-20121228/67790_1 /TAXON_ID=37318 /ORGANISM="Pseudo-nitzschia pungens, Strain cf. pungens" /LENGTH=438 /DNA_ID=CAMNT_0013140965 /DNA_START=195 /DNA_END=1511 /DNA_ORIENTATION=-